MDKRKIKKYETFSDDLKKFIIVQYEKLYSVTKVLNLIKIQYNIKLGRKPIEDYLKSIDIYEGLNGENYLKTKVANNEKILMERYGVKNWGQTENGGYKLQNKIPYERLNFIDKDIKKYKTNVEKLTRLNIKKMKMIPEYCFYTGIKFIDCEQNKVNPNDPRKRSIDHKIPVIICYFNNIPAEKTASIDNLVFVLKYVNSIKGNTLHESFLNIAPKLRKAFINAGYKSN